MSPHATTIVVLAGCAFFGACSTTTIETESPVHSTVTGATVTNDPKAADAEEWGETRASLLRTFAFRALESNLLDEGREYLTQACEADPEDVASHAALARLLLSEGDAETALVYASRAARVAADDPEVSMVYAAALAENQRPEEASAALETAWEAIETDPEFARSLLVHYAALGQTEQAKDFVTEMLTESPEHAVSWAAAGDLLLAEGDLEAAAESYRRALELDPTTPTPNLQGVVEPKAGDPALVAAQAAERAGNLEEAGRLYRFLTAREDAPSEARLGLARCLWAEGRYEEAEMVLDEVPFGARGWRGHLLQARLDVVADRYGAARTSLLLALRERPDLRAARLLLEHVDQRLERHRAEADAETTTDT